MAGPSPQRRGTSYSMVGAALGAVWSLMFARLVLSLNLAGVVLIVLFSTATGGLTGAVIDALIRRSR